MVFHTGTSTKTKKSFTKERYFLQRSVKVKTLEIRQKIKRRLWFEFSGKCAYEVTLVKLNNIDPFIVNK